ncbi:sensor histidine kinase [Vibrio porteresiae]
MKMMTITMTPRTMGQRMLFTAVVVLTALVCSYWLDLALESAVAVLLLLELAVVLVAFYCEGKYAYIAAIIGAVCFNFLFTIPRYSLVMWRQDDIINLLMFIVVALLTSRLAERYKRQQDALKQAQLRNQILLSVSHDLRTPLATIIGTLSTLKEYQALLSKVETDELLDSATQESHRLHQYIENLLQATKLQHGALKVNKEEESLLQVVSLVLSRLGERASRVVIEAKQPLPTLSLSSSLIAQALFNVVDNALRYSPLDTQVTLHLYSQQNSVVLDVQDQGIGFSVEQAEQMFELFYSQKGLKHNDSGTGLGLAVARGLIAAHQGTIEAIAQPEGSVFRITLPMTSGEPHCGA